MKKIATIVATALVSTTLTGLTATPALAQSSASLSTMQTVCNASIGTADNNNWAYTARVLPGSSSSAVVEVSRVTTAEVLPATVPVLGSPVFESGSETIRGGSPNIHGTFKSTATFDGGSVTQLVTTATDTTFPYGCEVKKTRKTAPNAGSFSFPVEMQTAIGFYSLTERGASSSQSVTVEGDDITTDSFSDAVVCLQPVKGTVWRVRNEYTGSCSAELYTRLAAESEKVLRQNSVPGLSKVFPNKPDHQQAEPVNNSNAVALFDNTPNDEE